MVRRCRVPGQAAVLLAAVLASAGCDCGREDGDPVDYFAPGGTHDGIYESSPLAGVWLHFPGGRRYRLHHELGEAPVEHQAYLAFEPVPVHERGEHAEAAGNSVIWEDINDRFLQLRNGSCATFYLRVVAVADDALEVDGALTDVHARGSRSPAVGLGPEAGGSAAIWSE